LKPFQKFQIIREIGKNPRKMCEIAKASRSGYYKWLKAADSRPKDYDGR
jgi:hypothetical protein